MPADALGRSQLKADVEQLKARTTRLFVLQAFRADEWHSFPTPNASVLFCDIRGFTTLSENLAPEETIDLLNTFYTLMFEAVTSNGGIVSLMLGDGLMALFGVPQPLPNTAQCAVAAGHEMHNMIEMLNLERRTEEKSDLKIGIGIATGEVVAGYAGTDNRATYTCIGSTVNLAARLEAETQKRRKPETVY